MINACLLTAKPNSQKRVLKNDDYSWDHTYQNCQNIVKQSLQWSHKWIVQKIKTIESKENQYIPNRTTHVMYKHDNNSLPTCLDGMFQTNSRNHNYNTRNRNQLRTTKHRLAKTEHSIRFLEQQIWNAISGNTKMSNTIPIFKAKLKTILIQNR